MDPNKTQPLTESDTGETKAHSPSSRGELEVRCPSCHSPTDVAVDTPLTDLTCASCGGHFSLVDQSQATRMAPTLSQMGRFELIERIGVGGFGSVWKARDKELDRTVAIKIPRQGAMTAEDQEKFFREARAAAQLRHPNIVSVHEVGRDGDSVYIVSDLVRGVTLGDWLTSQQLTSREAAELCAKIADALHHAHEKGVVHRDLKPANIMMDGEAKPHLMDFGLARRDVGEVTVTMDGQVIGTPAYMSPEQAQGEAHKADRRSDVYSLGVILFQLLTGELPFRGNARMIMHQVINDEPPSPRKLNAHVARDLETMALKCLEKDPARRYQTAQELVAELNRYLAGEPIHARPIGGAERAWRWVKRNPRVAALTASVAVLLVAIAALSTVGFAVAKKQQLAALESAAREAQLREDAQQSAARESELRGLAEQNLDLAEQAVDGYLTRVAEDERLKQSNFHKLRTELLETAVPFYEQFAKQKPGDAQSEANRADAYARLAKIHGETGRPEVAAKEFLQAILAQAELAAKHPLEPKYQRDLAEHHLQMGWNFHVVGNYKAAQPHYQSALDLLNKLSQQYPDRPEYRHLMARAHEKLGMIFRYGDVIRAHSHFQQAIKLEEAILAAAPNVPEYQSTFASSSFYLGAVYIGNDAKRAREHLTNAVDVQRKLVATQPKDPEYRAALSESVAYLGAVHNSLGERDAARRQYEQGIAIAQQVGDEFPSVIKYQVILAGLHATYGNILRGNGDIAESLKQYELHTAVRERMAVDFPDVAGNVKIAAAGHEICAGLASQLGDFHTTESHLEKSLELYDQLVAKSPGDKAVRQVVAGKHSQFAERLANRGQWSAALKHNEAAIQNYGALVDDDFGEGIFGKWMVLIHDRASDLASKGNDWPTAKKHQEESLALLQKLAAESPEQAKYQSSLMDSLNQVAWLLATSPNDEVRDGKRAVELSTKACALSNFENPKHVETLAAAYAETGNFDAAVKWATKAIDLIDEVTRKKRKTTFGWLKATFSRDDQSTGQRKAIAAALERYQEKKPTRQAVVETSPQPAATSSNPPPPAANVRAPR